jgi:hypothetical protein
VSSSEKKPPDKGQREADQVRQIAMSHGGKVTTGMTGGRPIITITYFGTDPEAPQTRAMLYAIEFAVRGRFDRGRTYPGMTQFMVHSRLVDVVVRCFN